MIKEFKDFIKRGNVFELAVGVIMGVAIGNIVSSLVNDIIMPLIGIVIGGLDFSSLKLVINSASINYGLFIQSVVNFVIIAGCVFLIIKVMNKVLKTKKEEATPADDIKLLTEIRDLLKKQK